MNQRAKAHKDNPKLAIEIDWITNNETQLKKMHRLYQKDTKDKKTPFIEFADFIYNNGQDLLN